MDWTVSMKISSRWKNPWLILPSAVSKNHTILVPDDIKPYIWIPDLHILSLVESTTHKKRNLIESLRLNAYSGIMEYTVKLTATIGCALNLKSYPIDTEICSIGFESFSYNSDELILTWSKKQHEAHDYIGHSVSHLPKFHIQNLYRTSEFHDSISRITFYVEFDRHLLSTFLQVYIPSGCITLLAGSSMWIDLNSTPARVTMSITTVLSIITIIASSQNQIPEISYLTALDVYLWSCFGFIFLSVIEYIWIHNLTHVKQKTLQEKIVFRRSSQISTTFVENSILRLNDMDIEKLRKMGRFH